MLAGEQAECEQTQMCTARTSQGLSSEDSGCSFQPQVLEKGSQQPHEPSVCFSAKMAHLNNWPFLKAEAVCFCPYIQHSNS